MAKPASLLNVFKKPLANSSVKKEEFHINSSAPGISVYCVKWTNNSKKKKGVIQLTHGLCEHIGRYEGIAEYFADRDYVVYGNDHVGHGKTAGLDKLGIMPDNGYEVMVEDMHKLYETAKKENPGLNIFLIGHSMGSFLARCYTAKYSNELKGSVFCGSGALPNFARYLEKPLSLATKYIGKDKGITMKNNMLTTAWLSIDPVNRYLYLKDEYINPNMTLGLFKDCALSLVDGSKKGWDKKIKDNYPMLFESGTMDIVGFCTLGIKSSKTMLDKDGFKDVTVNYYKFGRHEIMRDFFFRNKVYNDIYKWVEAHN